jgi:hypothetical protein
MKMFEDNQGHSSSMRVAWFICVLIIMFVWAYCSVIAGKMVSFSVGDAAFMSILFGGKVVQKKIEG